MKTIHLSHNDVDGVRVLRPVGSLDHQGVARVEDQFQAASAGADRLVVDLSGVDLIATPGISLLISAARRAEGRGGRLVVTGARGIVLDLIQRCRLDSVLTIAETEREAIRLAKQGEEEASSQ